MMIVESFRLNYKKLKLILFEKLKRDNKRQIGDRMCRFYDFSSRLIITSLCSSVQQKKFWFFPELRSRKREKRISDHKIRIMISLQSTKSCFYCTQTCHLLEFPVGKFCRLSADFRLQCVGQLILCERIVNENSDRKRKWISSRPEILVESLLNTKFITLVGDKIDFVFWKFPKLPRIRRQ